jgi:nucleoside-diphosphate-sugar epimerase
VKVLVIGGNRFVGRDLVWRFLAAGYEVTTFNRGRLADPFGPRVERLVGDRTTADFERLLGGREFDAVVDYAAFQEADTRRAALVLQGRIGHYVMISTGQVYLVREPRPNGAAREADYDGPVMAAPTEAAERGEWDYGMGKRGAEDALAAAWAESRFPSTRLRIPMVNGERDYHRRIEGYLWRLLDREPILLPDGGRTPTRHVYSGAIARAVVRLLGNPTTYGQAYNLAQDETPTLTELLTTLAEILGAAARFVEAPSDRIRAAGLDVVRISPFSGRWMSFLDPTQAKTELGFRHDPLRQYLEKIVASFLAHPPAEPPESYAALRSGEVDLAKGSGLEL